MERSILILLLGQFAFLLGVFWILAHYLTQRKRLRLEERSRILDRFTSAADLQAFLESGPGSRLFSAMLSPRRQGKQLVAQSLGAGITLVCIGLGFLTLSWIGVLGDKVLLIPGVLALATGSGVFLSGWIAQRLLKGSPSLEPGASGER